jgi:Ca-activated chloride channel family protein
MHYAYLQFGWISLILASSLTALVLLAALRKRRRLNRLAEAGSVELLLMVSRPRQCLKAALLLAAGALLAFCFLGPQWGEVREEQPVLASPERDLLIVLDVSRSMLAEDVLPNRLARAKADVRDLLASLKKHGGYRVGLIAFADRPVTLCPRTSDFQCLQEELRRASLDSLRYRRDLAEEGTQIGLALQRVARSIDSSTAPYTDVLLLSDGGDMEPDTMAAAEELARLGVPIHCIGLGSPTEGALIPILSSNGTCSYLQYGGEPVRTLLEEEVLRRIAQRAGGQYLAVGTGFFEMDRWFDTVVAGKAARDVPAGGSRLTYALRFQFFLAPAILLLLVHLVLGDRGRSIKPVPHQAHYFLWLGRQKRRWGETKRMVIGDW